MLKFFSPMLRTSKIQPFSLGNYLATLLIIENLTIIRVASVQWTWLGSEWHPAQYVATRHASLLSSFLSKNFLYFGVNETIIFQKLVGYLDKITVANLGRQHHRSLNSYVKSS